MITRRDFLAGSAATIAAMYGTHTTPTHASVQQNPTTLSLEERIIQHAKAYAQTTNPIATGPFTRHLQVHGLPAGPAQVYAALDNWDRALELPKKAHLEPPRYKIHRCPAR